MRVLAFASIVIASACSPAHRVRPTLTSTAETSQWLRTGRYDEAVTLCRSYAVAYDDVTCDSIGETTQGRPIVALSITRNADAPVILIQGGIHAGEIEGKDAGFRFLRDLLDGKVAPGALDAVSVVFIPVINPDGHERFGPNHRPNQRGPEEMGFRTNGARLNLNRDYIKADSPELRAELRVIHARDPVMLVDLHTTDGAQFEHDISVITSPLAPRGDGLEEAATALSGSLQKRLTELGHLPVPFYPSFVDDTNPHSGFASGEAAPRFSSYFMAARSRIGIQHACERRIADDPRTPQRHTGCVHGRHVDEIKAPQRPTPTIAEPHLHHASDARNEGGRRDRGRAPQRHHARRPRGTGQR